jgi:hypothetical protein
MQDKLVDFLIRSRKVTLATAHSPLPFREGAGG